MTLHEILNDLAGKKLEIDSKEWVETYEKLVSIVGKVGILTEQSTEEMVQKLDEIDNIGIDNKIEKNKITYGLAKLCYDSDGYVYIDYVKKIFTTREEAESECKNEIQDELETLGENFYVNDMNPFEIIDDFGTPVTTYSIMEFEEQRLLFFFIYN